MALERVFARPGLIEALRSGPLRKHLEGFCDWLLEQGFSRQSVRRHLSNVSHLDEHLGGPTAAIREVITEKDMEGFFKAYPSRCRHRGPLEDHLRCVRWSIRRKRPIPPLAERRRPGRRGGAPGRDLAGQFARSSHHAGGSATERAPAAAQRRGP
jgi:hypothetical protein